MGPRRALAIGMGRASRPDETPLPENADSLSSVLDIGAIAADAALVGDTRRRVRHEIEVNDRRSGLLTGGSFIVATSAWLLLAPPEHAAIGMFTACVAGYAVAGSVEFEIGPGCALPTTPVLVVMLFLLPPPLVPVAVVCGLGGAALVARIRDPRRKERAIVLAGSGWHAVGPAAVFALAHLTGPALRDWPVYLVALLAQFTCDGASSWVRNCYGLRVRTRQLADALQFTFLSDLFLAPIGFAAALALPKSPGALLLVLPPTALLAMLQSDRRNHIDQTLALSTAFADTNDLAHRDALTGLPNRLTWQEARTRYEQLDSPIGVMFADVDGLKTANDQHSHDMGDRLLIAVADILANQVQALPGALVARIGGDEFAIVLPDTTIARTHTIADSLRAAFQTATALDGVVPVSASIGVGFAPSGRSLGTAFAAADRGVSIAKVDRGVHHR